VTDQGPYRFYKPGEMKGRRTRWIWIGLGVLVAIFIIWLIIPHGSATSTSGGAGGPPGAGGPGGGRGGGRRGGGGGLPTTVGWARVVSGDAPIYLYSLGTATPAQTVTVRTQISGQLLSVAFKEGQMVLKGQVLAQIDPRPYEQQLLQAQGNLARDQAQLDNARIDLRRYETLLSQDSIARQQVDTQRALVRQYEGTIKTDQAAISAQRLNLIYCRITSPVSGRVGLRQVDPGNYVTAGDTNGIVVVTEVSPIDVLFTVPEDNLSQVSQRIRSGAVLQAAALDRTQKTQLALGKLLTLDNQVDTTTGTVRAKARFDNSDGALFPNQFINIRLLVDSLHNAMIAPTSAILRGSQGLFVWVVDPTTKTVEQRPVKTGPAVGDNTAITSGLDVGEIVVTDGSDRLRDSQRVYLSGDCMTPQQIARMQTMMARGGAGGGTGGGGRGQGGAQGGAMGAAPAEQPKTLFNLFGLLSPKAKPQNNMFASMACKPGQVPISATSGPSGGAFNGGGAAEGGAGATPTPGAGGPAGADTGGRHHGMSGQGGDGQGAPAGGAAASAGQPNQSGQGSSQGGGQGGGMSARLQAMFAPLGLDPAQQAKITAITEADRPKIMAAYQSGDMAAGKAAREAMDKQIDAVLRPDQKVKMDALRKEMAARRAAAGGGGGPQ